MAGWPNTLWLVRKPRQRLLRSSTLLTVLKVFSGTRSLKPVHKGVLERRVRLDRCGTVTAGSAVAELSLQSLHLTPNQRLFTV